MKCFIQIIINNKIEIKLRMPLDLQRLDFLSCYIYKMIVVFICYKIRKEISMSMDLIEKSFFDTISLFIDSSDVALIKETNSFSKVNIDSITFVSIIVELENIYGFEFDEEFLFIDKWSDVKSIINYILKTIKKA